MSAVGRKSFVFDGGGQWQWLMQGNKNVPFSEMQDHYTQIESSEGAVAARDFRALIKEKLRKAARGELREPEDGRAYLARRAGVMEIKWGLDERQWRLYYCEPIKLLIDRVMLGLLFNRKDTVDQQDQDIDEAANRWIWWQRNS